MDILYTVREGQFDLSEKNRRDLDALGKCKCEYEELVYLAHASICDVRGRSNSQSVEQTYNGRISFPATIDAGSDLQLCYPLNCIALVKSARGLLITIGSAFWRSRPHLQSNAEFLCCTVLMHPRDSSKASVGDQCDFTRC